LQRLGRGFAPNLGNTTFPKFGEFSFEGVALLPEPREQTCYRTFFFWKLAKNQKTQIWEICYQGSKGRGGPKGRQREGRRICWKCRLFRRLVDKIEAMLAPDPVVCLLSKHLLPSSSFFFLQQCLIHPFLLAVSGAAK